MKPFGRLRIIVGIICVCLLGQLGISWKLWLPFSREFPLISALGFFNVHYGNIADTVMFSVLVLGILALGLYSFNRLLIWGVVFCFFVLILEDITRFQPWVYMYCLILLSVAFLQHRKGEQNVLFMVRLILAATYFWSGIQKLNHAFTVEIFPWLMSPSGLKDFLAMHHRLGYSVSLFEMAAGIFLLFKPSQKYAGIVLIGMHLFLLYLLGPFGNAWNKLIWPWNAALIIILVILIKEKDYPGLVLSVSPLYKSVWFFSVMVLTCIMPIFNFIGYWDYDLSESLYSGNDPEAIFYYIKADRNNMPVSARHAQFYYPGSKGEFLMVDQWALDELAAPVYPQERYFKRIAKYLCSKVTQPASAGLIINEKDKFTSKQYEINISCDSLEKLR